MSWAAILAIIEQEAGEELCAKIKDRVLKEYAGARITITSRIEVDIKQAEKVAPGNPREIARALGVHPSTVYRAIKRGNLFVR